MADVQLEDGYTRIANELLEALAQYRFTEMQYSALLLMIRLSYGCGKKTARFKTWAEIGKLCGIERQNVKLVLWQLQAAHVVFVDWENIVIGINKNHSVWHIERKSYIDSALFEKVVRRNLNCNDSITNVMTVLQMSLPDDMDVMTVLQKCNYSITNDRQHVILVLHQHDLDPQENSPSDPPKESKNKEIKEKEAHARSKELATLNREEIIQFGFYLNSIYEICNPTAEDHLRTLTEIVKTKDRQSILDAIEQLKQARVSLPDRLDWLHDYLEGSNG